MTTPKVPKGPNQARLWEAMLDGYCVTNPSVGLKGKAKQYSGRYVYAWEAMLARARAAGYTIRIIPGPMGGQYSGHYRLEGNGVPTDKPCAYCDEQIPRAVMRRLTGGKA